MKTMKCIQQLSNQANDGFLSVRKQKGILVFYFEDTWQAAHACSIFTLSPQLKLQPVMIHLIHMVRVISFCTRQTTFSFCQMTNKYHAVWRWRHMECGNPSKGDWLANAINFDYSLECMYDYYYLCAGTSAIKLNIWRLYRSRQPQEPIIIRYSPFNCRNLVFSVFFSFILIQLACHLPNFLLTNNNTILSCLLTSHYSFVCQQKSSLKSHVIRTNFRI